MSQCHEKCRKLAALLQGKAFDFTFDLLNAHKVNLPELCGDSNFLLPLLPLRREVGGEFWQIAHRWQTVDFSSLGRCRGGHTGAMEESI